MPGTGGVFEGSQNETAIPPSAFRISSITFLEGEGRLTYRVQAPTKYKLVINPKTAKGEPASLLARPNAAPFAALHESDPNET